MIDFNLYTAVIILSINGLNIPIKLQILSELNKTAEPKSIVSIRDTLEVARHKLDKSK